MADRRKDLLQNKTIQTHTHTHVSNINTLKLLLHWWLKSFSFPYFVWCRENGIVFVLFSFCSNSALQKSNQKKRKDEKNRKSETESFPIFLVRLEWFNCSVRSCLYSSNSHSYSYSQLILILNSRVEECALRLRHTLYPIQVIRKVFNMKIRTKICSLCPRRSFSPKSRVCRALYAVPWR